MKQAIVVAVVSSLISAIVIYIAGTTYGVFKERVTTGLVSDVASVIIKDDTFKNFILAEIEKNPAKFKGEVGPEGPQGAEGLQGAVGPQGPAGLQGDKGDPGVKGATGECPLPRVIAALYVRDGQLIFGSPGVTYNTTTGVVTFPNPNNLAFVPLVTDASHLVGPRGVYMTTTQFVDITFVNQNQFKVGATPLDTSDRIVPISSFMAIVVVVM